MVRKSALAILCVVCATALAGCSSGSSKTAGTTPATTLPLTAGATLPTATDIPQTTDPCTLLTVKEASALAGRPVKFSSGGGVGALDCVYQTVTKPGTKAKAGAEIAVKVDASAAAAAADFPSWVMPLANATATGLAIMPIKGFSDQATETRNKNVNDGLYVRKGPVLVKIGAFPPAGLAALKAAATTALSRVAY